ncbi:hypothetical protein BC834DRAFT_892420, partial [Gloeopeniophorella convolvens]
MYVGCTATSRARSRCSTLRARSGARNSRRHCRGRAGTRLEARRMRRSSCARPEPALRLALRRDHRGARVLPGMQRRR